MIPDPLSIAAACIGIGSGITTLTMRIGSFVSTCKRARQDLDAVSRELTSLNLSLATLKDDDHIRKVDFPETTKKDLMDILVNIEFVTHQIDGLLRKLSSVRLNRKIQWVVTSRDETNKYRSSLETHKNSIEIARKIGSIQILTGIRQNVTSHGNDLMAVATSTGRAVALTREEVSLTREEVTLTRGEVSLSRREIEEIAVEMRELKRLIAEKSTSGFGQNLSTQDYLIDSLGFAESLVDPFAAEIEQVNEDAQSCCSTIADVSSPTFRSSVRNTASSKKPLETDVFKSEANLGPMTSDTTKLRLNFEIDPNFCPSCGQHATSEVVTSLERAINDAEERYKQTVEEHAEVIRNLADENLEQKKRVRDLRQEVDERNALSR